MDWIEKEHVLYMKKVIHINLWITVITGFPVHKMLWIGKTLSNTHSPSKFQNEFTTIHKGLWIEKPRKIHSGEYKIHKFTYSLTLQKQTIYNSQNIVNFLWKIKIGIRIQRHKSTHTCFVNYNYKSTEIIFRYTMDSDNTPTDIGDSDNSLK